MTFLAMQNQVFRLMRDPSKTKFDLATIKQWLNTGEQRYCSETQFNVEKDTSISTVAETREYALPTDYKSIIAVFYNDIRLYPTDVESTISAPASSGDPALYYIRGKYIGFEPIPAEIGTITLAYFSIGGDMVNDNDEPIIPEEHHMIPVYFACHLAAIENEDNRIQLFFDLFREQIEKAKAEDIQKEWETWPEAGGSTVVLNQVDRDNERPF